MKDIKDAVAKPRKVALYARIDANNWYTVREVNYTDHDAHYTKLPDGQWREITFEGYVRITSPVEVRFSAISDEAIVQNAVATLDEEERTAIADLNTKIAQIRERKQQLLTLTHQADDARVPA